MGKVSALVRETQGSGGKVSASREGDIEVQPCTHRQTVCAVGKVSALVRETGIQPCTHGQTVCAVGKVSALREGDTGIQPCTHRQAVCVVGKVSTSREGDTGINLHFPRSSCNSNLKIGIVVSALPGAWCYWVDSSTGWPCVSIL